MLNTYTCDQADIDVVEEALAIVWSKDSDFVFPNKKLIRNTIVVSYDSKFLYLWSRVKILPLQAFVWRTNYRHSYRIPHEINLEDTWQSCWQVGLIKEFNSKLPDNILRERFKFPIISGGLLTPFITLQLKKTSPVNPYTTRESYLATLVHEFGHVYWNQHKLWFYSNKKDNLGFIKAATKLTQGETYSLGDRVYLPTLSGVSELYAVATEYYLSTLLWPNHQMNLDKWLNKRAKTLAKLEERADLLHEDSVLDPHRYPHDFALVFAKIVIDRSPKFWPQLLTRPLYLDLK